MKSAGTIQKNTEKRASHDVLFSLCENAADRLILLVLLGSVLLFILWPIACIALRSLRGADGGVSFAMFGTVLRQYGESLRNSVFVGVFTAVLSTILSLSAALVCATARGWKKTLCMVIMLVAMVSPPFVSSLAYGGTSLGRLSGAIADITRAPFAVHLNSAMTGAFETLAPYITQEPLKTLVQDVAGNADAIAACCMSSPDLFPFVTTTIAPTMIRGGSAACNVMPQDMTAVINFRLADGDTVESVMAHCREAVQDKGVEMRFLQANDPSAIAKRDGYGYRTVVESFQRYYPEAVFIPSMAVGATDAHRYEEICDTCLRCSPFMTEPAEAASGVHGTNERLLVRSYLQGIRVLIDLMEHANVEP